jgi:hypothetical protein
VSETAGSNGNEAPDTTDRLPHPKWQPSGHLQAPEPKTRRYLVAAVVRVLSKGLGERFSL